MYGKGAIYAYLERIVDDSRDCIIILRCCQYALSKFVKLYLY